MTADRRLESRVALISGAAGSTGAATARLFAQHGARLALFDADADRVDALAGELGAVAVAGDAADWEDADRAVAAALDAYGALDVLVTCSGEAGAGAGSLGDLADGDFEAAWRARLESCLVTTRAALDALVASRGVVVVVSPPGSAAVADETAQAALLGFTRSVAVDYGPQGVRINAIRPAEPGPGVAPVCLFLASDDARHMTGSAVGAYA